MFAKIKGATLSGISGEIIEIESALSPGLNSFQIIGLADEIINESKERINLAIRSIGAKPPNKLNQKFIVNLAPADIKKEGSQLDLPIALSFLFVSGQLKNLPSDILFLGELGLDGKLKKIKGCLPLIIKSKDFFSTIVLPKDNLAEASFIKDVKIYCFHHLNEVIEFLEGRISPEPIEIKNLKPETNEVDLNFININDYLLRGVILGICGHHNFLLFGPPGTGKTLIAQSIVNLLPNLDYDSALEVSQIYSALGLLENELILRPPFRSPHHSASATAILGGGKDVKPGEITLAHRGVLFFDELPEFRRDVLEGIREPLETGEITVARAKKSIKYPAKFLFVGAYNPCPCGYYGDPEKECKCSISEINRYQKKISGPIIDRIDIYLNVPRLKSEEIFSSKERNYIMIKEKIIEIYEKTRHRYKNENFKYNSEIPANKIKKFIKLDEKNEEFLKLATNKYKLSLRAIHKILKLARTIADYEESENIKTEYLSEALQYRIREN
ncbi:MAG: Fis family transcriptional regulator [Candidatus Parcubacteria bacterium]|nr:MAG: Fis family transcriptional regulator [Candidatus Parcubacteria bacterium]